MGRFNRARRQGISLPSSDRILWIFITGLLIIIILGMSSTKVLNAPSRAIYENDLINQKISPVQSNLYHTSTVSRPLRLNLTDIDQNIVYNDFNYLYPDSLTYRVWNFSKNGLIYYRFPKKTKLRALLLIFHGCGRHAKDWFTTIERQRIVGAALDLGFGCLAFQSTNVETRCWSNSIEILFNADYQMINDGINSFLKLYPKLKTIPLFTFGASSGGIFSSLFSTNKIYKIHGQILYISFIHPEILNSFYQYHRYPDTVWIYMPRDTEFASEERINKSTRILTERHIPNKMFDIQPICLTSTTFSDRIPSLSDVTSKFIYDFFCEKQWLDEYNRLKINPRDSDLWRSFTSRIKTNISQEVQDDILKNQNILPDFFSTVYAEHEISFERSYEALKWLWDSYSEKLESVKNSTIIEIS